MFTLQVDTWEEHTKLTAIDGESNDLFGGYVDISIYILLVWSFGKYGYRGGWGGAPMICPCMRQILELRYEYYSNKLNCHMILLWGVSSPVWQQVPHWGQF